MAGMPNVRAIDHEGNGEIAKRLRDGAIAELAERQYGVVTRRQLHELGFGRGAIELALARGRLHRVHAGVYAVGHTRLSVAGRRMAGVLAGGPGAVLSHATAAAHWGILPSAATVIDVMTPLNRRSRPGLRFHRSRLPPDEVTVHEGIPVTSITRTLFDLAAVVSLGQLGRAVREAEARRLWDRLSLRDLLARHLRSPGAAAIRTLADADAYVTRSEFEERLWALLDAAALQRPLANVTVHLGERFIEVDFAWPHQRVVVELDGHATHGTRASFEEDRARDRALAAAGWRVIRLTWRQLRDEPEAVLRDLRAALASLTFGRAGRSIADASFQRRCRCSMQSSTSSPT
jgi:very-short-patch-repair endonuclease